MKPATSLGSVLVALRQRLQDAPHGPALVWLDKGSLGTNSDISPAAAWTFQEVWNTASIAAARLQKLVQVSSEEDDGKTSFRSIGLAVPEGPALPLLELAALLSGRPLVPLDPQDPGPRLAHALDCADVVVAVAENAAAMTALEAARELLPNRKDRLSLVLAESLIDPTPPHLDHELIFEEPSPRSCSHIFFTSGSTGRPKGCVVSHRALVSYCAARNTAYSIEKDTSCLIASAHTFDPSLGDLLATWMAGGKAVYAPRAAVFAQLGTCLAVGGISHLCCTPSLFATLSGTWASKPGALPTLKVVTLGGEPTPTAMVREWVAADHVQGPALWNTYGVTECAVYNTARLRSDPEDSSSIITPALPGNGLLVVAERDDDSEEHKGCVPAECDPDIVGELVIYGDQVGEGYANQPELSEKAFRWHPEHGRCYMTGDLAKRLENGSIALLGRRDHQVKVRGFRIELAEAEHWLHLATSSLLATPGLACLAHGDRLLAFLVPCKGLRVGGKAESALRATLRWLAEQQVPLSMRPQQYIFLDNLPLTASGKVARGALKEMLAEGSDLLQQDSGDKSLASEAPQAGLEATVAASWAAELGVPVASISRSSNFVELGGHSLVALRACRRLALALASGTPSHSGGAEAQDTQEALLGGDLGELTGPFAPCELLGRPCLSDYARFLNLQGFGPVKEDEPHEGKSDQQLPASSADDEELSHGDAHHPSSSSTSLPCPVVTSDSDPVSLLHRAASSNAAELIRFLVEEKRCSPDGHCSLKRLKASTRAQRSLRKDVGFRPPSPLHSAAMAGAVDAVQMLLVLRATVTATEAHGVMALHLAATQGPLEALRLLLEAGAPLAAKDLNLQTVLHYAARSGCIQTMPELLRLWCADTDMCTQGARVYGGPLDWRDRWHRTPVHWAALNDRPEVLAMLLHARAAPEPPRIQGSKHAKNTTLRHESPLEIAERRNSPQVQRILRRALAGELTDLDFELAQLRKDASNDAIMPAASSTTSDGCSPQNHEGGCGAAVA